MTSRTWIRRLFAPAPRTRRNEPARFRPRLEALEDRCVPTTFTVNSTGDSGAGSGLTGDLRYCITQANAAGGTNTIDFSLPTSAIKIIELSSALPTITDNLTINGPGASRLAIDGQGTSGILSTSFDSGAHPVTVAVSGLTLANGSASYGGGISNFDNDNLTITNCIIASNTATVNAGGVLNDFSTLTLIGCWLTDNSAAGYGGGIQNEGGSLTLIDCTLTGNSAGYKGGGLATTGGGSTTVVSCTLASNSAPLNGGAGLYNETGATTTMYNTIVASDTGGDVFNAGTLTGSNNLVQDGSDGLPDTIKGDPLLAPLAPYGGPTKTMALFAGSPAIGAADATLSIPGLTLPGTDQRGFPRVVNNLEDIGAFQTQGGQGVTPTVAITAPPIAVAQAVVTFTFTVTDPATAALSGFDYLIDWNGDGSDLQIVQGSTSVQVTHVYAAAGSYTPTVTALDPVGRSSIPTAVAAPYVVAALDGSALDQAIQSLGSVPLAVSDVTQENTAFAAINSLPPSSGTGTGVTVTVAPGTYTDAKINTSSGAHVTVKGSTPQQWSRVENVDTFGPTNFVGSSPALEVDQGSVTVFGVELSTPTDAPTILVTGGTLVLLDDFVLGTPNGDQPVIEVDGGTLILGPQIGAYGNELAAYGAAQFVHVTGSGRVIDLGGNAFDHVASDGALTPVPGQLTLTQLTSSAQASVYGQSVTFTATVTAANPGNGTPTGTVQFVVDGANFGAPVALTAGQATSASVSTLSAGTHFITAIYSGDASFLNSTGTYSQTVTPAPLTITADSTSKTYGQTVTFAGTEFSTSGLVNSDSVGSVSLSSAGAAATATVAGSPYAIIASNAVGSGLSNYSISYVNGSLSVTPAPLTITASDPLPIIEGESVPTTDAVTYSGFVNNEGPSVLSGTLTFTFTPTTGGYTITPGGLTSANYAISFLPGTLTVLSYSDATRVLLQQVANDKLDQGMQSSLDSQLQAALADFNAGETADGVSQLGAFIHHVNAQNGKQIDAGKAGWLVKYAERIITAVG